MDHSTTGQTPTDATYGTDGDDVFIGGAGADIYVGGFGDDYIEGGDGDDWLEDGFGSDWLVGGDGNDTLRSTSDTGESRIGQLVIGDPSRPSAGDIDMTTYKLETYNDQPLVGDDVMTGGEGNDHFLFELQINAKEHIIEKHADADGNIDWKGVAGENKYMHDHWVDGIGVNVITDFNADEDQISIIGHTTQVGVDYRMIDSDGDGVNDEWVTILKVYSQQGMAGGAHDEDIMGYVVVHGDRVYGDLINTDASVHYGIIDNIADIEHALDPAGETKTHADPDLIGYDSRDVAGNPIGSNPSAYSSNPWLLDDAVDMASGGWANAPDTGGPAADDGSGGADMGGGDDAEIDANTTMQDLTTADSGSDDAGSMDGGTSPEQEAGPSTSQDSGAPAADDGSSDEESGSGAGGNDAPTLVAADVAGSGEGSPDASPSAEEVAGPSTPQDAGGPAADDGSNDEGVSTISGGSSAPRMVAADVVGSGGESPDAGPSAEEEAGPSTPQDAGGPAFDDGATDEDVSTNSGGNFAPRMVEADVGGGEESPDSGPSAEEEAGPSAPRDAGGPASDDGGTDENVSSNSGGNFAPRMVAADVGGGEESPDAGPSAEEEAGPSISRDTGGPAVDDGESTGEDGSGTGGSDVPTIFAADVGGSGEETPDAGPSAEEEAGPTTPQDTAGPAADRGDPPNAVAARDSDDNIFDRLISFLRSLFGGGDDDDTPAAETVPAVFETTVMSLEETGLPTVEIDEDVIGAVTYDEEEADELMVF